jgi:hypothetical protein
MGWLAKSRSLTENSYRKALVLGTVMASHCVQGFSCSKTSKLAKKDITSRVKELKKATELPDLKI